MLTRRTLLTSLGALASVACVRSTSETAERTKPAPAPSPSPSPEGPRRILMLGGTGFLGPHFVRDAVARGHIVTLFNRGKTNPHLFPELEQLRGDRQTGELDALAGREFDAIVDTSAHIPTSVTTVIDRLGPSGQYLFISSVSAYRDQHQSGLRVDDPLAPHPDPGNHDVRQFYGPLKAQCEQVAEAAMPGKTTIIRPGLIVGPGDPSDRFTYWPVRLARAGEVMAPGEPSDPVQVIDARDLATFMTDCIERRLTKPYNAVGPAKTLTVEAMLRGGIEALGSDATLTWVPADFLDAHDVMPWMEMTVWVPPGTEMAGLGTIDNSHAVADGLSYRPLRETMIDTLAWWNEQPEERRAQPRAGLDPAREVEVLAAWHAASTSVAKAG